MRLPIDVSQRIRYQLGIKHGGGDIGMTEHLLHRSEVRTVFQKMGGKGMAQHMRRDVLLDACRLLIMLDDLPEALPRHTLAADIDKQGGFILR